MAELLWRLCNLFMAAFFGLAAAVQRVVWSGDYYNMDESLSQFSKMPSWCYSLEDLAQIKVGAAGECKAT
ncbi:hypothetical protein DUI87_31266 [Hirundo rustica rustica]|uniref:Uncharacterized protein n=1 Tax=Hirundo rustica rustica TaxID=333673 RepID=A0A3M0IU26_HIRRU|nr:hypothetical protein DUI87_31266 [Hirundo rustica rustica]